MVILSSSNFHFTYVAELYLYLSCSSCRQHLASVHDRCSPTCTRSKVDWSQQFLGSNGKLTHALAGCVKDGVRDGGCDPNQSKFADPFRTQRVDAATRDRLSGSADDNAAHGLSKALASNGRGLLLHARGRWTRIAPVILKAICSAVFVVCLLVLAACPVPPPQGVKDRTLQAGQVGLSTKQASLAAEKRGGEPRG
jgi:hypothetical protein